MDVSEAMFLFAAEGILLVNKSGKIIIANPASEKMFGYASGEIIGRKIEILIPDRFRKRHVKNRGVFNRQPRSRKMGMGMDLYGRRKDGSEFPVEVSLSPFNNSRGLFVIAFVIDITVRKAKDDFIRKQREELEKLAVKHTRILKELKADREQLQRYLDVAGVMFVVLDKSGKVKLINKRGCEILGYREEDIIGKNWFINFLPKSREKNVLRMYREALAGKNELPAKYENPILRSDGQERIISWNNILLRDETGKVIGSLSSGEDITDQRNFERRMLDAALQGQEQERERLAKELHDGLGVLLSTAKANLGALEPGIAKIGRERAVFFHNSLSLLDDAIREIRTIISDLSPRILEDRGLVAALRDLCEKLYKSHKFAVKFYSSVKNRFSIPVEKTLYRIGQELVNNAVKYSKADTITVQLIRHGNLLTLTVEDNGIGFDTHYLFEHDGRGHRNIANRVKHINGSFHIESSIGDGTLATVEVPLNE